MTDKELRRFLENNPYPKLFEWHPMNLAFDNREKPNPKNKIPETPASDNKKPPKKRNLLHGVR